MPFVKNYIAVLNCSLGGAGNVPTNPILCDARLFLFLKSLTNTITAANFTDYFLPLLQKEGLLVKPAVLSPPFLYILRTVRTHNTKRYKTG